MKTRAIFLLLITMSFSFCVQAQLNGKKFEAKLGEMGTFKMEFKENTFFLYNSDGQTMVMGEYQIKENTITLIDKEGPISCQPGNKGNYKFTLTENELILELIDDNCPGRKALAISSWKLKK
jgi:hypothetical protein